MVVRSFQHVSVLFTVISRRSASLNVTRIDSQIVCCETSVSATFP